METIIHNVQTAGEYDEDLQASRIVSMKIFNETSQGI